MMYEELIERLTIYAESYEEMFGKGETSIMMLQAVDAIEELNKKINKWQEIAYDWRDEYYHLLDNTSPLKVTTETLKEEA